MKTASGMVTPIVKVPQALSASALTTTMPRPASAMTTMKRTAMAPVMPATGPISVRAISAERPAAAARRRPEDRHVVHGAGEAAAGDAAR